MALPPLVTVADLEGWLGQSLVDADRIRAEAVLSAVSALVRSETNTTWVDDAEALTEVSDDIRFVVLSMTARVWRNPDGFVSERLGEYSYQLPSATASGADWTAMERRILGRTNPQQRGLWSLSTTRDDPDSDTAYVPVLGGPPFPWYGADVET